MNRSYDVIIIGGGVNGCSIAYYLAREGKKVLLLERDKLAGKASSAAAGMLGAQVEVTEEGALFDIAKESRAMFPSLQYELKEHSGIDIELVQKGMLKLALKEEEARHLKSTIAFQQMLGERAEWLAPQQVAEREGQLSDALLGGMDIPMDGHVNPERLTHAFAKSAVNLGADVKEYAEVYSLIKDGDEISGVETSDGKFHGANIVVATGAWSKRLLDECGIPLPAYPVKGECFSVITERPLLSSTVFTESCYLVPKSGNRLVIGATMVPDTFSENVTVGGLFQLMKEAAKVLPAVKSATFERFWSGIRPQTGDGLPYLGRHLKYKNLVIATGHYRNGILLSPITGKFVTKMIQNEPLPVYMEAFKLNRSEEYAKG
ncbi:glycine oxidase ThiO [Sutcliffiella horikoshii]|uniref:glycine oxidase ThiO n=1 Tax=Sutcliffiella horikoshii TaxID=79883 RepID=UPI0007D07A78|nr:glycine oxidase ThiO [Sutcliffiella horikoshii]MCM3617032.1 glycine oxidase ThiO [Sutcliffiella horikoshii]